jgi:hypothetical protein
LALAVVDHEVREFGLEEGIESLPLYPKVRAFHRSTARKVIDLIRGRKTACVVSRPAPGHGLHYEVEPVTR